MSLTSRTFWISLGSMSTIGGAYAGLHLFDAGRGMRAEDQDYRRQLYTIHGNNLMSFYFF